MRWQTSKIVQGLISETVLVRASIQKIVGGDVGAPCLCTDTEQFKIIKVNLKMAVIINCNILYGLIYNGQTVGLVTTLS